MSSLGLVGDMPAPAAPRLRGPRLGPCTRRCDGPSALGRPDMGALHLDGDPEDPRYRVEAAMDFRFGSPRALMYSPSRCQRSAVGSRWSALKLSYPTAPGVRYPASSAAEPGPLSRCTVARSPSEKRPRLAQS